MYKVIAFDFDGTIVDSYDMCMKAFRESIAPYLDRELTDSDITQTFGLNEKGTVKSIVKDRWAQALDDFHMKYEEYHNALTEPFAGIRELIAFLKERGVTVALITGKGEYTCDISLRKVHMTDTFSDVLCGTEFGPNKDRCLQKLLEKYHLDKSELAYIADSPKDIKACRTAGVTCLSAAWQPNADAVLLKAENPDLVFDTVKDLQTYLNQRI